MEADCWARKGKQKDYDVDNLLVGEIFYGEVKEENYKVYPK